MTAETTAVLNAKRQIKPFVKWAGGKGQLINEIRSKYPEGLGKSIVKYAEPFVGGGAVLFDILSHYNLKELYISDVNAELINAYKAIRENVFELIDLLQAYQDKYISIGSGEKKAYFYAQRSRYNELLVNTDSTEGSLESAALFIFLNRTCFNGLYRVNKKGTFNVPAGAYRKPTICNAENLLSISSALKNVKIIYGDYKKSKDFIDNKTFAYFDPPYRPLTNTSSFTAYSQLGFNDAKQEELSYFVQAMAERNAKLLVSNSDPKNIDENDNFFDILYSKFNIKRVKASRIINSKGEARGKISELLISNY
ncbi:MAG TPA: hypothetical protein DIV41_06725 [Ruminococcaceae bacterium]|jgi:DNA adenine methylase|nr:hypothetical protein [Oscillospiraceae bacterium]